MLWVQKLCQTNANNLQQWQAKKRHNYEKTTNNRKKTQDASNLGNNLHTESTSGGHKMNWTKTTHCTHSYNSTYTVTWLRVEHHGWNQLVQSLWPTTHINPTLLRFGPTTSLSLCWPRNRSRQPYGGQNYTQNTTGCHHTGNGRQTNPFPQRTLITHKVVTCQPQAGRRAGKMCRPKTNVLTTELCRQPYTYTSGGPFLPEIAGQGGENPRQQKYDSKHLRVTR